MSGRFRIDLAAAEVELAGWDGIAGPSDSPISWYASALEYLVERGTIEFPEGATVKLGTHLSGEGSSLATTVERGGRVVQSNGALGAMFGGEVEVSPRAVARCSADDAGTVEWSARGLWRDRLPVLEHAATEATTRPGDRIVLHWTSDPESPIAVGARGTANERTERGIEVDWDEGLAHVLVDIRDVWQVEAPRPG